jgi:hypothetical protein
VYDDVRNLVSSIITKAPSSSSSSRVCFITDKIFAKEIYRNSLVSSISDKVIYVLKIEEDEAFDDETSEKIYAQLSAMKLNNCNYYVILILNGIQMVNFLKYFDHHRLYNTNGKFIMLHDYRLFATKNNYLWKRIINVIFIRKYEAQIKTMKNLYEISTVPFPNAITNFYVSRVLNYFAPPHQFLKKNELFNDTKSHDLLGNELNIVVYPHIPAVVKLNNDNESENQYTGVEVELIRTISKVMNFKIKFYETIDNEEERWGRKLAGENYTGLLYEMSEARADIAIADLYHTMYHYEVMDFSIPYTIECLTFITPEILGDNSWKVLILPYSLGMWIGVFVSLFSIIIIFYLAMFAYRFIQRNDECLKKDLFKNFGSCIIYSYSMLLVVSLPNLPNKWTLRVLTGWWLIYSLLIVVAYRASLTSILANPQPKLTIDTLEVLAESNIKCGIWGDQNKQFFIGSSEANAQKIGNKLENVDVVDDAVSF